MECLFLIGYLDYKEVGNRGGGIAHMGSIKDLHYVGT